MRTNRMRWSVVPLGAALLLAGCGGAASSSGGTTATTGAGSGGDPLLTAYRTTVAARTASISLDVSVTGTSAGQVGVSGTGQVDFASGAAQFTLGVPSAGSFQVRLVKPVLYLQFPSGLGSALPAGKSWVSVDLDSPAVSSALGASFSQLSDSAGLGTNSLSYLEGIASGAVTTVGPDTVRGVATTEYTATIDLAKAAQLKDPAARSALQKLQATSHLSTVPVHVWIDAQGQVRRITLQESVAKAGGPTDVQVTIEYYDFGAPVEVAAPPAAQVVDISGLTGAPSGSSPS